MAGDRDLPTERTDHQEHPDHLDPLAHVSRLDEPDAEAEARARAGRAVRDLGHALVGRHASVELVERVGDVVTDLVDVLSEGAPRDRQAISLTSQWVEPPDDGATLTGFDERPVSGRASPWGLDLDIHRQGREVVAHVTLRAAHEGAPGRSHGGVIAALFDDVYGFVLNLERVPGFTGELGIRYAAGVPIGRRLECRVRLDRTERRKLLMSGELRDGDQVLVTSTATFITVDPSSFATS